MVLSPVVRGRAYLLHKKMVDSEHPKLSTGTRNHYTACKFHAITCYQMIGPVLCFGKMTPRAE